MIPRRKTGPAIPTGITAVLLVACLVMGLAIAPAATAQEDPAPVPATFYGEVTIDGEPAPAGTTITAEVDGEIRGSFTVETAGEYGGPTVDDDRLVVNGTQDDVGEEIIFRVNGEVVTTEPADVTWDSATDTEVDLIAEDLPAAQFDLTLNETASELSVTAGDDATVAVDVTNIGDDSGTTPVTLTRDGSAIATTTVSLDPDETTTVSLSTVLEDTGDVPVTVSTDDADLEVTLEATAPATGGGGQPPADDDTDPSFEVSELDPEAVTVEPDATLEITATITNTGSTGGNQDVELRIDDELIASESVTLGGEATTEVVFTDVTAPAAEGDVTHGVFTEDDSATGTITVEATADDVDAVDDTADVDDADAADEIDTDDEIPGFTGMLTVLALLVGVGLLRYQQR